MTLIRPIRRPDHPRRREPTIRTLGPCWGRPARAATDRLDRRMSRDAEEADTLPSHADEPPAPRVSGRPKELSPGHHVETITGGDRWMQAEAFLYDLYLQLGYCEESPRPAGRGDGPLGRQLPASTR